MPHAPIGVFDPWGVDSVTVGIAILAALMTALVRWWRGLVPAFSRRRVINDFLNGSVLYPFLLLVVSVTNSNVFGYLRESRISLGLAGCVEIVFVVGELILSASPDRAAQAEDGIVGPPPADQANPDAEEPRNPT